MDLIRIYSEIAFSKVALRYLDSRPEEENLLSNQEFLLPADAFLDEARIHHPELSDDHLHLIYLLGLDEWCRFGLPPESPDSSNIFRSIAFMASQMLDEKDGWPTVHFKDLFRWRDTTQRLGEDLLTCALLAFNDRDFSNANRKFDWPSTAHNDNPDLNFLFRTKGLCELHTHLKATTNTFEISWVSLMNHIGKMDRQFEYLASQQEPSNKTGLGNKIYSLIIEAAKIRWDIYELIIRYNASGSFSCNTQHLSATEIDIATAFERNSLSNHWIPDYIMESSDSPMSVYSGERRLVYTALHRIFASNDPNLTDAFYRYILIKNMMRSYMIQLNPNIGFSNFQRYQNLKTEFLEKNYKHLTTALPLWEARTHNHTRIFESRITPIGSKKEFLCNARLLHKFISKQDELKDYNVREILLNKEWMLIFHFLKRKSNLLRTNKRDWEVRKNNKYESVTLSKVSSLFKAEDMDAAIDAASSEFYCRPEVFGQAFRFLRHYGFDATFHAGEDFYDLADGLRAIEETIRFLNLKAGDRIGHALALGMDAQIYYNSRHRLAALPKQWMLDNSVWLLMKSKISGIQIDSKTEWFLTNTYKRLANELGYSDSSDPTDIRIPDISDYWDSMILRGDDPDMYNQNGIPKESFSPSPDIWDHYSFLDSEQANFIRISNPRAVRILLKYHNQKTVENGNKVKVFPLPPGYSELISAIQEEMIKEISKRQLCIECCPSSNVRIGRLDRFENHPIFRFFPINPAETRYPLAVTVNTDDLGVFSTSLPNEFSLLALALLKKTDPKGNHLYSKQDVYDWIGRVIDNGHKYTFISQNNDIKDNQ